MHNIYRIPIEGAVTYDLSDASLITEKTVLDIYGEKLTFQIIDINITEDGNYGSKDSSEVFPVLDIAGTANVYVREASELSATTRKKSVVEVGGTFRMKGTDTDPALTITSDSIEDSEKVAIGKADYGLGKVYIEGGILKVNGGIADMYEDKRMSEIGIHGGNLYLDKKYDALLCAYDMEITGGNIDMA